MPRPNPLTVLGVPEAVVLHVHLNGDNVDKVLKLAEANYKTLSKQFHPDMGGDADLWSTFGDAISELRDPDALEYFCSELVGEDDIEVVQTRQRTQVVASRNTDMVFKLAGCTAFVNQFEIMGVARPTTCLLSLQTERIVLNVMSPHETTTQIDSMSRYGGEDLSIVAVPEGNKTFFEDGTWVEQYRMYADRDADSGPSEEPLAWLTVDKLTTPDTVRVAGFVELSSIAAVPQGSNAPALSMDKERSTRLGWQTPQDSWFLQDLVYPSNGPEPGLGVIVSKRGKLAFAGVLLDSAPLPLPDSTN